MAQPRAIIIAGPNGAGKTTFADAFLGHEGECAKFINVDSIESDLLPQLQPEVARLRAMRMMIEGMETLTEAREDFAIESTLSGRGHAKLIRGWHMAGYRVKIIYLRLDSVELAVRRVQLRVLSGGHDVPEHLIRLRFTRGWHNFVSMYRSMADVWQLFDTSGRSPVLLDEGRQS
jgi:predicted ABC-type ATPase